MVLKYGAKPSEAQENMGTNENKALELDKTVLQASYVLADKTSLKFTW